METFNKEQSSIYKLNFNERLICMWEIAKHFESHLQKYNWNATYIFKTTQNDLLVCIKDYIWHLIVAEV